METGNTSWTSRVVKIEGVNLSKYDVKTAFAKCGEIRTIHYYRNSRPNATHYFVEFKDEAGGARARELHLRDHNFQVYLLSSAPHLVSQYLALTPTAEPMASRTGSAVTTSSSSSSSRGGSNERTSSARDHNRDRTLRVSTGASAFSSNAQRNVTSALSMPGSSLLTPDPTPTLGHFDHALPSNSSSSATTAAAGAEITFPPSPLSLSSPLPSTSSNNNINNALLTPDSPIKCLPPLIPHMDTRIYMSLCGEPLNYDVDTLDADPQTIISLLRVSSTGRANWMVVACSYRRRGYIEAAQTVLYAMLEAMKEHGVQEADLKPAFLMLATCEADLAKRARASSSDGGHAQHEDRSKVWFQKVYGLDVPHLPATTTMDQNALGLSLVGSGTAGPPKTAKSPPTGPKFAPPTSPRPSQVRALEREIQSLRATQVAQTREMMDFRGTKRKLEDLVAIERNLRKKMERQLEDAEAQLAMARRMETSALDQVKREVELRRRAEERAVEEREKRLKLERERDVKPLFEDLAGLFQRAAKGESISFGGPSK